jgi:RHS repeat-associated protein
MRGVRAYNNRSLVSRTTADPNGPVGTVHYIYDTDGHLIAEADGATGATTREYVWLPSNDNRNDTLSESILPLHGGGASRSEAEGASDLPLALVEGTTLYQVHTDHLGRPTRMTHAGGATVWAATWKPWGEVQSISGTILNNLRFPGQYFQIETGLAYNWHRHYDPVTGRYTQPDPLGFVDGPSVYAYAGNSPFMNVDRDGRLWWVASGAAIGAGMNVVGQLWDNGGDISKVNLWCAARAGIAGAALGGVGRYAAGWAAKWKGIEFSHYVGKRFGGIRSLWNGNFVRVSTHARSDSSRYRFMPRSWRDAKSPYNVWGKHFFRIPRMPAALAGSGIGGLMSGCGCD